MDAVLRGKFIALSDSKAKLDGANNSSLTAQMKALEQKEADTPKKSRRQEIIKIRAEIDQIETKRPLKKSTKPRVSSLRKSRLINP